jgi:hypothetical protein
MSTSSDPSRPIVLELNMAETQAIVMALKDGPKLASFVAEHRETLLAGADAETIKGLDQLISSLKLRENLVAPAQRLEGTMGNWMNIMSVVPNRRPDGPKPQ